MNIVVLDGFTLNPGDLDWQVLADLGELSCYDRSLEAEIIDRGASAEIIFTNKTPLTATSLRQLPKLKYIGLLSTGANVVDLSAARELGIMVTNVPGYGPDSVAQMVFAHILHHTQRVSMHHDAVVADQWSRCVDFCFTLAPLQSLKGKTMGLVGYGDIGKQVATVALAFGMKVLVNTRSERSDLPAGVSWCELDAMLSVVDILSLHCPLTAQTEHMINRDTLKVMGKQVILINTARGGLIDEAALKQALAAGDIAAAGVDVLSSEPPEPDNPLLSAVNISISPHNSWATIEARQNLLNIAVANLKAYCAGKSINRVN